MKLENQTITSPELFYLMCSFLLGTSVVFLPGARAESNAWLAVLLGIVEGFLFLSIYMSLVRQHPGKNLMEILDLVFGTFLGKTLTLLYSLFFLYVSALVLRTFSSFFAMIMTSTPLLVFMLVTLFASSIAVRAGLVVLAKYSQLVLMAEIAFFLLETVLLVKDIDLSKFLPFMDIPIEQMLLAVQSVAAIPFGEAVVFLVFFDSIRKPATAGSFLGKAFLLAGTILFLNAARTTVILGSYASIATYPVFSTVRMINAGDVFTRLEILVASVFLSLGLVQGTVFYYAAVLGTSHLFGVRSYKSLILPIGALILTTSLLLFEEYAYDLLDASILFPIYSMVFAFFLPLLTLIVAKFRKAGTKRRSGAHA